MCQRVRQEKPSNRWQSYRKDLLAHVDKHDYPAAFDFLEHTLRVVASDGGFLYVMAIEMALTVQSAKADPHASKSLDLERYRARTVEVLRDATRVGYRNADQLKATKAFQPFLERDNFQAVLRLLEGK